MAYQNPSVADFQSQFIRDFQFGTDPNISILDADITRAFQSTNMNVNQSLFPDQGSYTLGYNLLSAHYLTLTLRASSQGINGQFNWLQSNKSVGSVTEAFSIPQQVLDNPYFSMFTKTNYGMEYLQLIFPQLVGAMFSSCMPAHSL